MTAYAQEKGFANCRHYTDDGYSGGTFDRPGWQQLLADIEAGMVKRVLVKDMSRVGRNYVETGFYTEAYFAQVGVRFIAIDNNIDNGTHGSTEFAGILNIMNHWYLRDVSRKTRSAAQQKGIKTVLLIKAYAFRLHECCDQSKEWTECEYSQDEGINKTEASDMSSSAPT